MADNKPKKPTTPKATGSVVGNTIKAIQAISKVVADVPTAIALLEELPAKISALQEDLTLGHEVFEAEMKAKKEVLEQEYAEKLKELEAIKTLKQEEIDNLAVRFYEERQARIKEDARIKADLEYELQSWAKQNKIAKATEVVKANGFEVVTSERLQEFVKLERTNSEELEAAEKKGKKAAEVEHNFKYNSLKQATDLEIAKLTVQLEAANKEIGKLEGQVTYLKTEIQDTRNQIAKSVEAAKSAVNVTNTTGK